MRQTLIMLVLAGAGGQLAACGSSTHAPGRTHSAALAPTAATLTKSQALAFAHAVNLAAADVPDFTASFDKPGQTTQEKRFERGMLRCVGTLDPEIYLAEAMSKNFELN